MRLIDADAERERLKKRYCEECTRKGNYGIFGAACTPCCVKDAIEEFDNAQTVEAKPVRHGQWIEGTSRGSYSIYCSYCCSQKETICPSDYCPNRVQQKGQAMNKNYFDESGNLVNVENKSLAEIYMDGAKQNCWIKCSEQLPNENCMVLICIYGSDLIMTHDGETLEEAIERIRRECVTVTVGFIGSDGWYGADWMPLMVQPTYWMPLPAAPEPPEKE